MKPYRVLSLDGGGMRGLYTASVLKSLAQRFGKSSNKDIGKIFDLIVGTSTGGLQACGLAAGIPIDDIMTFYTEHGQRIFTNPKPLDSSSPSDSNDSEKLLNKLRSKASNKLQFVKKILWILQILNQSANSNTHLKKVLKETFGEKTMGELFMDRGIRLCIPALRLIDCGPKIFRTPHSPRNYPEKTIDAKRQIADVCLAATAAPFFLPVADIPKPGDAEKKEYFIDGGLWANNPTLIGLSEALELSESESEPKQKIEILSIGTSPPACGESIDDSNLSRGIFNWGFGVDLGELSGKAQSLSVTNTCQSLERGLEKIHKSVQICRLTSKLSPKQEKIVGLDQTSEEACRILKDLGEDTVEKIYQKCVEYDLIVKKSDEQNDEQNSEQSDEKNNNKKTGEQNDEKNNEKENCEMLQSIFSQLEDLPKKKETAKS